jgi:branched-chain amino acid transport system permease protein
VGVHVAREKHVAIAVSAALTALGGTFWAQYVLFIDPESVFPLSLSILICLVAVLGGVGSLWGPVLGAAILVPLSEGTRVLLGGTGKALDLVVYGALILLIAVFQPSGVTGLVRRFRRDPRPAASAAQASTA